MVFLETRLVNCLGNNLERLRFGRECMEAFAVEHSIARYRPDLWGLEVYQVHRLRGRWGSARWTRW